MQKIVFQMPELFFGLSNMKVSEAEQLYIEILGPTSQNLESVYAFIMCRTPKDLSGDKWA